MIPQVINSIRIEFIIIIKYHSANLEAFGVSSELYPHYTNERHLEIKISALMPG